ncbi:MAG: hypothetical protein GAK28_01745 [Luteibacter sp.]|uniref:hypothetical protein n=1 Tax=Luteibacter sp. TaxID=1886636 RepID=UPI00137D6541|nr:hypothetical protein [Luteibacter sp.]KAF1007403.1 MAG: hypothetical protein GAK28_01745 [Luteibacter sp.]
MGGWLVRGLVAAVVIQAIGIGILSVKVHQDGVPPAYHTYSQVPTSPTPPGAIHVIPDAGMKVSEWNALVHAMRLEVVGGPNDVGAYTVVPVAGASARADVLQRLRSAQGIRMAEPVADIH